MEKYLTCKDYPFLAELGLDELNNGVYKRGEWSGNGPLFTSVSPYNGKNIATIRMGSVDDYEDCIKAMEEEKDRWMNFPAPKRGEIVRQIGEALRIKKDALGSLISLEMGKIKTEGDGEV
jgi:aldehyde dehydrogenase family 7 protein A1